MPYYLLPLKAGTDSATSCGDGYQVNLKWFKAYPNVKTNKIAYNIYYSTDQDTVFSEGTKLVSIDDNTSVNILELDPGQTYFFAVRPVEYDPNLFDYSLLPTVFGQFKYLPNSLLRSNITDTSLVIPLLDIDGFPSSGVARIGAELIQYYTVDTINKNLLLANILQRGYHSTSPRYHNVDGYDGYFMQNPFVTFFVLEESNIYDNIAICQSRFEFPNNSFTLVDGYKQVLVDILTTDFSGSDAFNENFPSYDFAGWHRTDPALLLNGDCVGSYMGGYMFCADGYSGVGRQVRGLSFQDHNNQRQEFLLDVDGEPVVLLSRTQSGIVCSCYIPSSEYPDDRCPRCYGTKFVVGYHQYFNKRRSDRRIQVRFSPSDEDLKMYEGGLESEFQTDVWTLTVPTIKDRDVLVRYDQNDNEEFRYEVLYVNRNRTINRLEGGQKLKVQRIRKTDPIYKIPVFKNASLFPTIVNTGIGFALGIPPHTHEITRNENNPNLFAQLTSINQGHNHPVRLNSNGILVVEQVLGHTHTLTF